MLYFSSLAQFALWYKTHALEKRKDKSNAAKTLQCRDLRGKKTKVLIWSGSENKETGTALPYYCIELSENQRSKQYCRYLRRTDSRPVLTISTG